MIEDYDYIIDAFTKQGNNVNLEVDNLNVGCITSKNNTFDLDSAGNLTVNSITTQQGGFPTLSQIFDFIYPIGSIYVSVNSTNPGTLMGGTWEQIQDKFLLAAGSIYTAGSTGGEANHGLTANEMPSHTHTISSSGGHNHNQYFLEFRWPTASYSGTKSVGRPQSAGTQNTNERATTTNGAHTHTPGNSGGGVAHNNMPPYLAVYVWKRTA